MPPLPPGEGWGEGIKKMNRSTLTLMNLPLPNVVTQHARSPKPRQIIQDCLFDGHGFGQIPGLVHVGALEHGHVVSQELKRDGEE